MNCYRTESGDESINFTDTENLQEISPKEDSLRVLNIGNVTFLPVLGGVNKAFLWPFESTQFLQHTEFSYRGHPRLLVN